MSSLADRLAAAREAAEDPMNARVKVRDEKTDKVELKMLKDIFGTKRTIVFGLPSPQMTTTCAQKHIPGFEECYDLLKAKHGVEEIFCCVQGDFTSFEAALRNLGFSKVKVMCDEVGDLAVLLKVGRSGSQKRYAALFEEAKVSKLFTEPGSDLTVTDAATMFKLIAPNSKYPPRIALLSKTGCPDCEAAKQYFRRQNLHYNEIILDHGWRQATIYAFSGKFTVPQVFIDGQYVPDFTKNYTNTNKPLC